VSPEDSSASAGTQGGAPLFVYVTDRDGFTALFRPRVIRYEDGRSIRTRDGVLRVPSRAELYDVREGDTLRLTLTIDDATASDTRRAAAERGEGEDGAARALRRPWFVQMAGEAVIAGRIRGIPLSGRGRGFFETYR